MMKKLYVTGHLEALLAIIVLVMVASLSIAGCTSSTSSNQAASTTPSASVGGR